MLTVNEIKDIIERMARRHDTTGAQVIDFWRSNDIQELKQHLEEHGVSPPQFKNLVGMVGQIADLAFSYTSTSVISDVD